MGEERMQREEDELNEITQQKIVEEMEFDILQYLSIPHILYHHNLKKYYQNHPDSKLSHALNQKYGVEPMDVVDESAVVQSECNCNEAIQIEVYYAVIPFVSNL